MTAFTALDLIEPLRRAVAGEGYTEPTPIQAKAIPDLLAGRDLLGVAQTGTGKTAAFSLPLLQRLAAVPGKPARGLPRALVLAPTRELAGQIDDCLRAYSRHLPLRSMVVFGGVPIGRQIKKLNDGIDVLVATPGRLLDLMNQGKVRLDKVEVFVLDEADRMLDMGFIHDVRKIAALVPRNHQTMLFSATMPSAVQRLADGLLDDPVRVDVAPQASTAERIDQRVLFVTKQQKRALLSNLLGDDAMARVLIFTRTKHGADRVAQHLDRNGVRVGAIHGNKSQNAREQVLRGFGSGRLRALVATDIAARGIDVDGVTHVVNYDLPRDPESYVHRIGRTARAGAAGIAISLCDAEEQAFLRDIEKTIRRDIPVVEDHPFHVVHAAEGSAGRDAGNGKAGRSRPPRRRRGRPPRAKAA